MPRLSLMLLLVPVASGAQEVSRSECEERYSRNERYCEEREIRLPVRATYAVDAGQNGGVTVIGWGRDEVLLRARIQSHGRSESRARTLMERVRIRTDGVIRGDVSDVDDRDRDDWSISFELYVPRRTDLDLSTLNGGIRVEEVEGSLRFSAVNGGIHLTDVGGDVRGSTQNGGLHVELGGERWRGNGLDVRTQNGGVHLAIPRDYSANLVTGTQNGGMRIDFPITVNGYVSRRIETRLGDGGATVRAVTTNGGVQVRRSR
jgi:hypothetical protein